MQVAVLESATTSGQTEVMGPFRALLPIVEMPIRIAEPARDSQAGRYLELLRTFLHDGLTDFEAARLLGVNQTSVNARRKPFVDLGQVYHDGFRIGPSGKRNKVWKAR